MRSFIRIWTVASLIACLSVSLSAQDSGASRGRIELMHPETLYAFRGLDGKGFLKRNPVNLPEPFYDGSGTGLVALRVTIAPSGQVSRVAQEATAIATATPEMIQAAKDAVMAWKFMPLGPKAVQNEEVVRVVIQFNQPGSGVRFSEDGRYMIEGLGARMPVQLVEPRYYVEDEGVVTAIMTIDPAGEIAWIDQYYGAYPHSPAVPRLGLITNEAVRQWKFNPLPADQSGEDQQVKVVFHYIRWKDGQ
jgi:hypothetical protein